MEKEEIHTMEEEIHTMEEEIHTLEKEKNKISKFEEKFRWCLLSAITLLSGGAIFYHIVADRYIPKVSDKEIEAKELEYDYKKMVHEGFDSQDLQQPAKYDSVSGFWYQDKSPETMQAQQSMAKAEQELEFLKSEKHRADSLSRIPKSTRFKNNLRDMRIAYHKNRLNALSR